MLTSVLATARLTRLVTTDDLGQWWLVDPAHRWVHERRSFDGTTTVDRDPDRWPRSKARYLDGLSCPWCVGFWIGAGVLGLDHLLGGRDTAAGHAWRYTKAALALNYVVGHLESKL